MKPEFIPPPHRRLRLADALLAAAFIVGLVHIASPARAQNYAIDWHTIDSGGGASAGGVYALSGTVGQPDAGVMTGGSYGLVGGFWSLTSQAPPSLGPLPRLSVRLGAAHTVVVSWPGPAPGYVLQQTPNMNAANGGWMDAPQQPVDNGPNREVTVPATGGACLFRLRRP